MGRYELLTDGRSAFDEILRCCAQARRSILVNMFVWRDDDIGSEIAKALLAAAKRGVHVTILKDRLGGAYERAEENGQSFWHKGADPCLWVSAAVLRLAMPPEKRRSPVKQRCNPLVEALLYHPNVDAQVSKYRLDHTKYYIFDDGILISGGINIEEKEVVSDITGAKYHDFMFAARSSEDVALFKRRLSRTAESGPAEAMDYICNSRVDGKYVRGILYGYLEFIAGASKTLCVMMPYIGERSMERALLAASLRGTDVTLIIPSRSNFQQEYNMLSAKRLYERSGGRIKIYITTLMCHSKLMIADSRRATLGSANLNRDGTSRGCQLNCVCTDPAFVAAVQTDFDENLAGATLCRSFDYRPVKAFLEGIYAG